MIMVSREFRVVLFCEVDSKLLIPFARHQGSIKIWIYSLHCPICADLKLLVGIIMRYSIIIVHPLRKNFVEILNEKNMKFSVKE